jgi:uncharacterized protein (TIRG00374 family)
MKIRIGLIILGFIALGGLITLRYEEVLGALDLIKNVKWYIILTIPLIQLISFYANAQYYRNILKNLGYNVSLNKLYRMSMALNYVNQVFPSGGVSSATFIVYGLRDTVPAGKAALAQAGRYILTYISFTIILFVGVLMLYFSGSMDKIVVRIVVLLVLGGIVASIFFLYILRSNSRFDRLVYFVQRIIDKLVGMIGKRKHAVIGKRKVKKLLGEFHGGYEMTIKEWSKLRQPFFYALLGSITEIVALYMIFLALGAPVNPGAAILGYASGYTAGATSIIPGDLGILELAMIAAFRATGITLALGLSVTVIYRVVNKLFLLIPGFIFYTQLLKEKNSAHTDS